MNSLPLAFPHAAHFDASTGKLDQALGYCEPDAKATPRAVVRGIDLGEKLEYPFKHFLWDAARMNFWRRWLKS